MRTVPREHSTTILNGVERRRLERERNDALDIAAVLSAVRTALAEEMRYRDAARFLHRRQTVVLRASREMSDADRRLAIEAALEIGAAIVRLEHLAQASRARAALTLARPLDEARLVAGRIERLLPVRGGKLGGEAA